MLRYADAGGEYALCENGSKCATGPSWWEFLSWSLATIKSTTNPLQKCDSPTCNLYALLTIEEHNTCASSLECLGIAVGHAVRSAAERESCGRRYASPTPTAQNKLTALIT
jgi:hypothetical protein